MVVDNKPDLSKFTDVFQNELQKKRGESVDKDDQDSENIYVKNPTYETDVKMYFDSEINAILDNVKGY